MTGNALQSVVRHLRDSLAPRGDIPADRELLARFHRTRDETAFAELVRRHGPLVFGVARRLLRHEQDAEDVLQAAFLVLARKAGTVRWRASVGGWLHAVAYRLACRARIGQAWRSTCTIPSNVPGPNPEPLRDARELAAVFEEELYRLPDQERLPLLLCGLAGLGRGEAAERLGWSLRTLERRLTRGRAQLRMRLARRGYAPATTLLAPAVTEVWSPALARAANAAAAGRATARARSLAHQMTLGLWTRHLRSGGLLALLVGGLVLGMRTAPAEGDGPATPRDDRAALFGAWRMVGFIDDRLGDVAQSMKLNQFWEITAAEMRIATYDSLGTTLWDERTWSVDSSADPKIIDHASRVKDSRWRGIYKLEGDRLTIRHRDVTHGPRPTAFEEPAGKPTVVLVLEREPAAPHIAPNRPEAVRGTWRVETAEVNGKHQDTESNTAQVWHVTDWQVRIEHANGDELLGCTVKPTRLPMTIDLRGHHGLHQGQTAHGIVKVEGDRMTVCFTWAKRPGAVEDALRPTTFTMDNDDRGRRLYTLKRLPEPRSPDAWRQVLEQHRSVLRMRPK